MPANLIWPCSCLSDTHSNVPYGTRKRNPLAATAADSMSRAMARDCDKRRMVATWSPSSQFRLSTLATVPVLITRLSSNPLSPVTQRPVASWYTRCDVNVASIGKVNRDRFARLADLDRHTMVLHKKPDLLGEIPAKKIRPRHRRLVNAGAGDKAIREARVEARVSACGNPDKWIHGTHAPV